MHLRPLLEAVLLMSLANGAAQAGQWQPPAVALPADLKHPCIACTPEELARLQAAWRTTGPAHDAVARAVAQADQALGKPIAFPPRGGQHNQWYQCDKCQTGLKTLDDTHHQCPRCKTVYTGEPYDDVIYERHHYGNISTASNAAWAYALTSDRRYAEVAAKVLLGYAERYLKYPYHSASRSLSPWTVISGGRLFEQTLNEAASLSSDIAPTYDLVFDALPEADRAAIRDGLLIPMLKNIDKHKAGKGNWQTWHNAAMLAGGAVLGDVAWVEKAIAQPHNGFLDQMKVSVTDDGMWYENSWGYHFYTLMAMVRIVEGARRLGIDLWGHPALKKMFTLPVRYTMADGSLPRFGDDVSSSAHRVAWLLEPAYHASRDPALLPLLTSHPTWESVLYGRDVAQKGEPPVLASEVFPGAGHAILRTRGEAGLTAALTFGPYGGFHGHLDKLSFVFFGHKTELGVDPGRAASQAYRLPIHSHWYKATISHNAVLVDASPQKPAQGKLELFAANEDYAAAAASCDAAYPGVHHARLLVMSPAWLLVFDQLSSDKPHRFDWLYHSRGSAAVCDAATADGRLADRFPGQEYIEHVKTGPADGPIRVQFAGKGVTTHLTMAACAGTTVAIGDGVGASVMDRVPMAAITRQGAQASFVALLEPVRDGQEPAVSDLAFAEQGGVATITLRRGETADIITLTPDNKLTVTSSGKLVLASK